RETACANPGDAVVGVLRLTIGQDPLTAFPGQFCDLTSARVVDAGDDGALDAVHEGGEVGVDLLQTAVVVEVVGLHIGDHGDLGREHEEGAVALVGLHRDDVADTGIGPQPGGDQRATDHVSGIDAQVLQNDGDHRGRGGLAVCSGDRDPFTVQQECTQCCGSGEDAQAPPVCLDEFGVVLTDGRGDHKGLGRAEVLGGVSHVDPGTHLLQFTQGVSITGITTGDLDTELQQYAGDTGHSRPTQTDEVGTAQLVDGDRVGRPNQTHRLSLPSSWTTSSPMSSDTGISGVGLSPRAMAITSRASSSSASLRPMRAAASDMATTRSVSVSTGSSS